MRFVHAPLVASLSLLAALVPSAACSNSPIVASSPFQGEWACTVDDDLTFKTPAGSAPQSNVTSPLLTIVADAAGDLTVKGLVEAGATCSLDFTSSGATATLTSGQTCSSGTISLTYGQGTASVTGSSLTAQVAYTFSGTVVAPEDGGTTTSESVNGTGTSSYTCTKNGT